MSDAHVDITISGDLTVSLSAILENGDLEELREFFKDDKIRSKIAGALGNILRTARLDGETQIGWMPDNNREVLVEDIDSISVRVAAIDVYDS